MPIKVVFTLSMPGVCPMFRRLIAVSCLLSASLFAAKAAPVGPDEAKKWQADIQFFRQEAPKVHRDIFNKMNRETFAAETSRLEEDIPKLSREQIIVRLAKILAMIGDGHTQLPLAQGNL